MKSLPICATALLCALLALCGCARGGDRTPSSAAEAATSSSSRESAAETSQAQTDESSLPPAQRAAQYAALLSGKVYYIDCTALLTVEGMKLSNQMLIAVRGENSSVTITSDFGETPTTIRMLTLGDKVYLVNDTDRVYTPADTTEVSGGFDTDFSALEYRASGEAEFDGANLPYEEYAEGTGTVRFFFDGNRLAGLTRSISDAQVSEVVLKINGISGNIPDRLIELPIGYTLQQAG